MNWLIPAGALVLGLVAGGYAVSRLRAGKQTMDAILDEAELERGLRRALAAEFAGAVEALTPESCDHRDRPSCPRCSARRTVVAAAKVVRETGGQP